MKKIEIQSKVLAAYRPLISRLVRELVPPADRLEGRQVAALGVLVAIERFRPFGGVPFTKIAERYARSESRRWRKAVAK